MFIVIIIPNNKLDRKECLHKIKKWLVPKLGPMDNNALRKPMPGSNLEKLHPTENYKRTKLGKES